MKNICNFFHASFILWIISLIPFIYTFVFLKPYSFTPFKVDFYTFYIFFLYYCILSASLTYVFYLINFKLVDVFILYLTFFICIVLIPFTTLYPINTSIRSLILADNIQIIPLYSYIIIPSMLYFFEAMFYYIFGMTEDNRKKFLIFILHAFIIGTLIMVLTDKSIK